MVSRGSKNGSHGQATAAAAAAATALQQHRGKEGDEGKRGAKSGSESSSDEPPASSSYSIMNNTFRVDSRYSGLKAIGKGSFGFVCSGLDEKQVQQQQQQ